MSQPTQPAQATLELRDNFDEFVREFEDEFRRQSKRPNLTSIRRMRKLLRTFNQRIYVPFRNATLGESKNDSSAPPTEL